MDNQQEYIKRLINEIESTEKSIQWYQNTYENRKFRGIVKDRVSAFMKNPHNGTRTLEQKISKFTSGNPGTKKEVDQLYEVSIIMLSYNRIDDTRKAIKAIYKHTKLKFELLILDNNSGESVKKELMRATKKYSGLRVIFETSNLGCAKGRSKAARYARYGHLLFLDNDIIVTPYYLENLFASLYMTEDIAGVCCKVVFPNGKIQFNGGKMMEDDQFALYSLYHEGLDFDDPSTCQVMGCEWIPGGATLWKRDVFNQFGIDENMKGSFEDNEICYRIKKAGLRLMNSPSSIVIHDHFDFKDESFKKRESQYYQDRNNQEKIKYALLHFYNKHHLIFSFSWKDNPWDIIWGLHGKEDILDFIRTNSN